MANVDYFLILEGVKGESQDKKHKEAIEIESFSWGSTNSGTAGVGAGSGAGKVVIQDVHCTMKANKASPILFMRCATGEHIKKGTIICRKAGTDQQEYLTIKLEDILVSSYQSGGHSGGDPVPTDQFSLNFVKVTYEYKPQKADGSLDSAVTGSWNVKTNSK